MLPILTETDFVNGTLQVSLNANSKANFLKYIDEITQKYILKLLSEKAYIDISTQLTLQAKYTDLLNGCNWIDEDLNDRVNVGFKEVLKRIIWAEYTNDNFVNNSFGNAQNKMENADNLSEIQNKRVVQQRYNDAVRIWNNSVRYFISENSELTKEITSFDLLGGNKIQINLTSTKYLYDNDNILLGGVEYIVSNLVEDTSFEIESDLTNINTSFTHEPFKDYELCQLNLLWL